MSGVEALMEPRVSMGLGQGEGSEDEKLTVRQQHQEQRQWERAGWKGGNPGLLQLAR